MSFSWVNLRSGFPSLGDFTTTGAMGTPIVVDGTTGIPYFLNSGNVITPLQFGGISIKFFGAVGDGVANDTAAFTLALAYIASTGFPVFVPPGTYLTDPFQIAPQIYADQGFFYGLEAASTIIQRRTSGAGAFVTIGSSSGTIFQAGLIMRGITLNGGPSGVSGDTCVLYDVVRSRFENVDFIGGTVACHSYGGIGIDFDDCAFQFAVKGFVAEHFTSSAGGGYPNLITLTNPVITNNSTRGVEFDSGRQLTLVRPDIENNGTTLGNTGQGGIWVGSNVGIEISTLSIGIVIDCGYFEGNLGVADIYLNSGINSVRRSSFQSQATQVTNDIKIDGGNYELGMLSTQFVKTANLLEGASVASGNRIYSPVNFGNMSYNGAKTVLV